MQPNKYLKSILLLSAICGPSLHGVAQALEEKINVEGRYKAEVIPAERKTQYPDHLETSLEAPVLEYDNSFRAVNFTPSFFPLPMVNILPDAHRGYLGVAAGNPLDFRVNGGVWILPRSSAWSLGAWLSHNSTAGWKAPARYYPQEVSRSARKDFDEAFGLQSSHTFNSGNKLNINADYNLKYFNYFTSPEAPTQTVNRMNVAADLNSAPGSSLEYKADLKVGYFSWRNFVGYDPEAERGWYPSRETSLHAGISMLQHLEGAESTAFSLKASLDGILPGHGRDYGRLSLTPQYHFSYRGVNSRLGIVADLAVNAGAGEHKPSAFHIAPACEFWLPTTHATYYLTLGGGTELNTLNRLYTLTQWGSPHQLSTAPTFTPIDLKLGFNAGPSSDRVAGVYGGLEVAYKAVSRLPILGWYPSLLSDNDETSRLEMLCKNSVGMSLHGFSLSGNLGWRPSSQAEASLSLSWQAQSRNAGYFNGVDRPEWVGSFKLKYSPLQRLDLGAALDWRGNRHLTGRFGGEEGAVEWLSLPDIFTLDAEADWHFTNQLSAGLTLSNITARTKNELLPGIPTEGFTAGLRIMMTF